MDSEVSLILNKCAAAIVVTFSGVIGALVPYIVKRRDASARYITLFESLASGTLLGLAIFHLFLEAAHKLEEVAFGYSIGDHWHNPAQAFVFTGFLLVLVLEHVPGLGHDHGHSHVPHPKPVADEGSIDAALVVIDSEVEEKGYGQPLLLTDGVGKDDAVPDKSINDIANNNPTAVTTGDSACIICTVEAEYQKAVDKNRQPPAARSVSRQQSSSPESSFNKSAPSSAVSTVSFAHDRNCCCNLNVNARALASLIALMLHSLFEGMLIGLASTVAEAWIIALGVISHKWAEAFALSCQYIQYNMSTKSVIVHHAIFCGMQPLAVLIGIVIQAENETVAGIFVSLACGTILYVATSSLFYNMSKPVATSVWQTHYSARLVSFTLGGLLMGAASLIPAPH